jgi:Ca2+-binding EF-hand superfamily protein
MHKRVLVFSLFSALAIGGCSDNDSAPKPAAKSEAAATAQPKPGKAFNRFDTDGNGRIARKEFLASFEEKFAAAFSNFDSDQDGNLNSEEFTASRAALREKQLANGLSEEEIAARTAALYAAMDKDKSASVSSEEFVNAKLRPVRKQFKAMDSDENNYIDPAEFASKQAARAAAGNGADEADATGDDAAEQ